MSLPDINYSQLSETEIALSDIFAKANPDGSMSRSSVTKLQTFLNTIGVSGYKGIVTPNVGGIPQMNGVDITENGNYIVSAGGDYGTITGISITGKFVILDVKDIETTAVYDKAEIPLDIVISDTPVENGVDAFSTGGAFNALLGKANADDLNIINAFLSKNENITFDESDVAVNSTALDQVRTSEKTFSENIFIPKIKVVVGSSTTDYDNFGMKFGVIDVSNKIISLTDELIHPSTVVDNQEVTFNVNLDLKAGNKIIVALNATSAIKNRSNQGSGSNRIDGDISNVNLNDIVSFSQTNADMALSLGFVDAFSYNDDFNEVITQEILDSKFSDNFNENDDTKSASMQDTWDKFNSSDFLDDTPVENSEKALKGKAGFIIEEKLSRVDVKDETNPLYYAINNSTSFNLASDGEWSWQTFVDSKSGYKLVKDNQTNSTAFCSFLLPYEGVKKELYFTLWFNPINYDGINQAKIDLYLQRYYQRNVQAHTDNINSLKINTTTINVGDELIETWGSLKITDSKVINSVTYNKAIFKFDLETLGMLGIVGNLDFRMECRGAITEHILFDLYASDTEANINSETYNSTYELDSKDEKYYNLSNASMRGDYTSSYVNDIYERVSDEGVVIVEATNSNNYKETEYGLTHPLFKDYGLKTPTEVNLQIFASDRQNMTQGFWLNKTLLQGEDLEIIDGSGGGVDILNKNLIKGSRINTKKSIYDIIVIDEIVDDNDDTFVYIQIQTLFDSDTVKFSLQTSGINGVFEIYNYTSFKGFVNINPHIEYPTVYKHFDSTLVGKSMVVLGDSNGGGEYGIESGTSHKRFSLVGRMLGLTLYYAAKGGWSQQLRSPGGNIPYSWLYYEDHRDLVTAVEADIYYFNRCTNDGNQGAYGSNSAIYGTGEWSDVENALNKYSILKPLLDAGDMNAIVDDEGVDKTVQQYAFDNFTTLGCTGAYIVEISKLHPDAVCVMDTTINSIGYPNALLGGFDPIGVIEGDPYEEDETGNLVYAPFLLSNVDVDGYPLDDIGNGTQTGETADPLVLGTSTLTDGNNYNLYKFYAYDFFGLDADVDDISDTQNEVIKQAVHAYYVDRPLIYGRLTPELTKNLDTPRLIETDWYYNRNRDYIEAANNLKYWLNVPLLDPASLTGVNFWNVQSISADAGHYNAKGHFKLGKSIAMLLNQIGIQFEDNYLNDSNLFRE